MTGHDTQAIAAVTRLRDALEQVAAALARPQLDVLLAGETAIEAALTQMPPLDGLPMDQRHLVRQELEHARRALMRCRRLGAALTDFVRISFEAQGRGPSYGPRPGTPPAYNGSALNARA